MRLDERLGNRETDSGTAVFTITGGVCAVEPLEQPWQVLGRDPLAAIDDRNGQPVCIAKATDFYRSFTRRVPQSVVKQIAYYLSQPLFIPP